MSRPRSLRLPSLTAIAIAINAAIALPLAAILNLWQDEAYTLHTTSGSLSYAFTEALGFEQNAPLYFVLLDLWRRADGSLFFARLFSLLCITITLVLVPRIVERYLPRMSGGLVTLTIALNPLTIWAALDVRVYAMIILISALLLLSFHDAFFIGDASPRWVPVLAYALFAAIGLYTQYYLGFLVAGQGVALAFYARSQLPRYLVASFLAILAFLPIAIRLPGQMQNYEGAFVAPDSPVQAAGTVVDILGHYVVPIHTFGRGALALVVMAAALVVLFIVLRSHLSRDGESLLLVITAFSSILLALGLYIEHIHVLNRHLAPLFLPIMLSMFALFTYIREPARARAVLAWASFSIAISLVGLAFTYYALAKPGDWIRVSAYLREYESSDQPIVVFEAENALPLGYYYHGPNRIVPIPNPVSFSSYSVSKFVVHDQAQMAHVMPPAARLWFISAGECTSANIDFGCDVVENYLTKNYRVLSTASFYGATVRLLVKREAVHRYGFISSRVRPAIL
ncbi:MAG: glycosyltransferase family 39 protein [Candidatus Aquilonibacter sp.]